MTGSETPVAMSRFDAFLGRELPLIQKIIDDETWLEGERRKCYVPPHDAVVQERVCLIVLAIGHEIREAALQSLAASETEENGAAARPPARSDAA